MNENELTILVNNEIEWRKKLWKKLESVEDKIATNDKAINGIKVKVSLFGAVFGALSSVVIAFILK